MTMGTPDVIIVGIILVSILIGIVRGFVKEFISLVTWVVAIILAAMFTTPFAEHMTFSKTPFVRSLCAFLLIFVSVVFIGAIINYIVGTFVRKTPFSAADRVLGSMFGVLRGVVFITILVLLGGLTPWPQEKWWQTSYFIPRAQVLSLWLKEQLPEEYAKTFNFSDKVAKNDKKLEKKPEDKLEKKIN